jgi:hypothetical protein
MTLNPMNINRLDQLHTLWQHYHGAREARFREVGLGSIRLIRYYRLSILAGRNLEGNGCGIEDGPAVITVRQMALDLAGDLRREAALQVFADQPDCGFTIHAHDAVPSELGLMFEMNEARFEPKRRVDLSHASYRKISTYS